MPADLDEFDASPDLRLTIAAEQLRLASTALSALAALVDAEDNVLEPHVERLECRAAELMRTAGRLARDLGFDRRWGLDILFAPPEPADLPWQASPHESVELEPLDLLRPIESPLPPRRRSRGATTPPWTPEIVLPTPPLKSASAAHPSADDSHG